VHNSKIVIIDVAVEGDNIRTIIMNDTMSL
jgi:hypothetical protein